MNGKLPDITPNRMLLDVRVLQNKYIKKTSNFNKIEEKWAYGCVILGKFGNFEGK